MDHTSKRHAAFGMSTKLLMLLPTLLLGACAQYHLTTADKAYERMAYARATVNYEKALASMEDRAAALRAAAAYQRRNMLERAAHWYDVAERMAPLQADTALQYGKVLHSLQRIPDALHQFDLVLAAEPDNAVAIDLRRAAADLNVFYIDTTLFTVSNVDIPGMAGAFAAVPYKGGLVFTGEREVQAQQENPWTGFSYLDMYHTKSEANGAWSFPLVLPGAVNGRFHDGPVTFDAEGRTMYFTRSDYLKFRLNKDEKAVSHLKLFRAEQGEDGQWGNIHQFAYNGETFSTGHAALSTDGNTLYFISDRPGGLGGTDLYRSRRTDMGWSAPESLDAPVNTSGNEMFPTLQGDTLYFASNGHAGLGGLDIFRTWPEGDGWAVPENLNYPINTPFDDFALVMLAGGRSGFLSSNRSGSDRIHRFEVHDPTLTLIGQFRNEANGRPMADVEVKLKDLASGEVFTMLTGPDGRYSFPLLKDRAYRVSGGKNGMFTESRDLDTHGQRISRTYREDFDLKEVVIERPIVVPNIYYDLDRWDIRPEAAAELDKLVRLFNDNPELSFELSSHTDSRASDLYNLVLSEARANSAVDYLVRQGVDQSRITAKGYGERKPVNQCRDGVECAEEEHQANRRTEFKVTRMAHRIP